MTQEASESHNHLHSVAYRQAVLEYVALDPNFALSETDRTFLLSHASNLAALSFEQLEQREGLTDAIRRKLPGMLTNIAEYEPPDHLTTAAECIERYHQFQPIVARIKASSRWPAYTPGENDFTEGGIQYREIAPTHSSFTYEERYLFWVTGHTQEPYVVKVWGNRVPYHRDQDRVQTESISNAKMLAELPALLRAQPLEEQVWVISYSFNDQVAVLEPAKGESLDVLAWQNYQFSEQDFISLLEVVRKYHERGLSLDIRNNIANLFYDRDTHQFQVLDPRDARGSTWETEVYNFFFFLSNYLNPASHFGGRRYNYSPERIKQLFWSILKQTESKKTLERMEEIMKRHDNQEGYYRLTGEL